MQRWIGKDFITMGFMICTAHQIFFGWSKQEEIGGACRTMRVHIRFWWWKCEEEVPLVRPRYRWENNIKTNRQEVGWGHGLVWSGSG